MTQPTAQDDLMPSQQINRLQARIRELEEDNRLLEAQAHDRKDALAQVRDEINRMLTEW